MSEILWLASYPKSGNTWMRVFLANLLAGSDVDINAISFTESASARDVFDTSLGLESSDLTLEEIETYRPEVFRQMARDARSTLFIKVHNAFGLNPYGDPLFPPDVSLGAIYIIRNPLDIAVSYAHHSGLSIDRTIDFMADEGAWTGARGDGLSDLLPTRLSSWSSHGLSWVDQSHLGVHIVRYEDMSLSPLDAFSGAASFAGIDVTPLQVAEALEKSSFANLRSQERAAGFRERLISDRPFFREGKVGSWRDTLTESQVDRIVERHGAVMQRFSYLSPAGQLFV